MTNPDPIPTSALVALFIAAFFILLVRILLSPVWMVGRGLDWVDRRIGREP